MAVRVDIKYCQKFQSAKDAQGTFEYLMNFPMAIPKNFPGVERFEEVDPSTFRWVFEKVAYSGHEVQFKLVTRFTPKENARIEISSLTEPGASKINGSWILKPVDKHSEVTFDVKLETELPIPFFLKAIAAPIVQKELTKLFDRYLSNVAKALSA
jgi:hypothetical protein